MNEFAAAVGYRHSRGKRESSRVPAPWIGLDSRFRGDNGVGARSSGDRARI